MLQRGGPCASYCRRPLTETATWTGDGGEIPHLHFAGSVEATMMWSAFCLVQAWRVPDGLRKDIRSLVGEKCRAAGSR